MKILNLLSETKVENKSLNIDSISEINKWKTENKIYSKDYSLILNIRGNGM